MGIFSRNRESVKRSEGFSVSDLVSEMDNSLSLWPWDVDKDASMPMKVATVFRCVKLLSESVAVLPLRALRRGAEGVFLPEENTRLDIVLGTEPNELTGAFDFWRQAIQELLCNGNAYIIPQRNPMTDDVDRLILCSANAASFDSLAKRYRVNDPFWGIHEDFHPKDIIHFRGTSYDGVNGMGVLEFARKSTDIALSGDKETHERFRNGGNVRGFFTNSLDTVRGVGQFTEKILKQQADRNEAHFHSGRRLSFLPGGVQFKELMMSSSDMQFLENRKFTVREICRFFGVHPSFVFDDTSNNYKSAEMANVAFLSNTLNPILRQVEGELNRKLLRGARSRRIEFDRSSLFACDLESRVKWQAQRIAAGIDSINDIRKSENRAPVEGGDEIFMTANVKSLGSLLNEGKNGQGTEQTEN